MTAKPKSGGSGWLIGCLFLAMVVFIAAGGGIAYLLTQNPDLTRQLPPGTVPLTVNLTSPSDGSAIPMNSFTTIQADALGAKPITALELYVDGVLAQVKGAPPGSSQEHFGAFWTWTPDKEGEHVLFVRATDADKRVGTSNIVRVNASKDANPALNVTYKPLVTDTIKTVAERFKTDPQNILDVNPALSPDKPIASGTYISVPIPLPPSPITKTKSAPPPPPSGDAPKPGSDSKSAPPSAPDLLSGSGVEGCKVNLIISKTSKNTDGFYVYRLGPLDKAIKRIATLDASAPPPLKFTDAPGSVGLWIYTVAAYNGAGESPAAPVAYSISDSACGKIAVTGIVTVDKAALVAATTLAKVDKVYCYLKVNDAPWKRIPPSIPLWPDTFLEPKGGIFDVSKYLKTLAPPPGKEDITLALECWGWQGGVLTFLGKATQTIKAGSKAVDLSGEKFKVGGEIKMPTDLTPMWGSTPFPYDPSIVVPVNLRNTNDPTVCANHQNGGKYRSTDEPLCIAEINGGYLVLVWEPKPDGMTACPTGLICDADGYNIYEINPLEGDRLVVSTWPDIQKVSLTWPSPIIPAMSIPAPLGGGSGGTEAVYPCYVVRAYKGTRESGNSNIHCPKTLPPFMMTAMLMPSRLETWGKADEGQNNGLVCGSLSDYLTDLFMPFGTGFLITSSFDPGGTGGDSWTLLKSASPLSLPYDSVGIGYVNNYDGGSFPTHCWKKADALYRGVVGFDLKSYEGKTISSATLRNRDLPSKRMARPESGSGTISCAGGLYLASVDDKGVNIDPLEPFKTLDTNPPSLDHSTDVTGAVQRWTSDKSPGAFVFVGVDEAMGNDTNACYSEFDNFSLDVTYIP